MPQTIALFFFAIIGFLNAAFLHWQFTMLKKKRRPMFCVIGGHCEDVVGSKYGKLFGIKNHQLGLIFYGAVILAVIIAHFLPGLWMIERVFVLAAAAVGAITSVYFLSVQLFVLKRICFWCCVGIAVNLAIFAVMMS